MKWLDAMGFSLSWLRKVTVLDPTCDLSTKDNFLDDTICKSYNDGIACELPLTHNRRNLTDGMLPKMLVVIAVLVIISSLAPVAFADTSLTLDPIPLHVYEGKRVTFTGVLYADGQPLAGKMIYIQEDDFGPDEVLASGRTDQNGRFSIQWRAEAATVEIEFDIYAIFEGYRNYEKDRTPNQEMDVFERRGTTATLYKIPEHVYVGDTVTFTGTLSHNNEPLVGKKVWIQDEDELRPDDYLKSGITDQYGRFSITWVAKADLDETEREIRAVFEGDSSYSRDVSPIQEMDVTKIGGDIILNRFSSTVKIGQAVMFSGTLSLDRGSPQGAVVYIKDEDFGSRDELLATGYVESNGRFSVTWIAEHTDFDSTVDIFAVFEGNSRYERQATCNRLCGDTEPLHISGRVNPSQPTIPPPSPGGGPRVPDGARYMEMFHALDLDRPPRVAIVADPDAYNQVRSYIVPVKEGIDVWSHELERAYSGGNWDVTFELVTPGERFDSKPDVIVNLITSERNDRCNDVFGWARVYPLVIPVQTHVCSTYQGEKRPNQDVARTAGHEFIHAMGLGHTFNKSGDVMCSRENGVPTCRPGITKSFTPSSLNLGAVAQMYGTDGFKNPNNNVKYKDRFAEGGYTGGSSKVQPPSPPPSTAPPTRTQYPNGCTTDDKRHNISLTDYELKSGRYAWYTICNSGPVQYSFSTVNRSTGFALHILPPETDVRRYINDDEGQYYTCEDPDDKWRSKSNTCNVDVGSRIVIHNDRDVSITINGRITADAARPSPPSGCTSDNTKYDSTVKDITLRPGASKWYTICNSGPVQYSFSTVDRDAGFKLHILPPETDVRRYLNGNGGSYYTCETPDKRWFGKSGTCNVDTGSKIVLHNDRDVSITINGRIRT